MGLARWSEKQRCNRWNECELWLQRRTQLDVFSDSKGYLSLEPSIFLSYVERTLALQYIVLLRA